jgi:hypothetical protein
MSKLLISYVNDLDAGTVTASSQHPSFPAINTQQRWFKKTWRSKYGASSGWGLFRVTAANQAVYFGEQKLLNGSMASWASATDLNDWTEVLTGTSTVNRENAVVVSGSYSCRLDIDAANNFSGIRQTFTLTPGVANKLSLWYIAATGKTAYVHIYDSGSNVHLQSDGTWSAAPTTIPLASTLGNWAFYSLAFNTHASYTNYIIDIISNSAASSSLYFDEVVVSRYYTLNLPVGDYDATTLCAALKTLMDAAAGTYTITYSDVTNKFTIAGAQEFVLWFSYHTNTLWDTIGFSNVLTYDSVISTTITAPSVRIHTSEFLYLNAGSAKTIKYLSLKGHNLQSTAVVTAHYYSDAFITPVASDAMTWHADTIALRLSRSYQYVAFEISDPNNPNFYVEVGRAWVGDELVLHYGYNPEHSFAPQDPSVISSSDDGQESTIQKTHFAEWNYVFDAVTPADRVSLAALFLAIGFSMPCFVVEAPPASGDMGLLAKYAKFTEWEEPHLAGAYWSMEVAMRSER